MLGWSVATEDCAPTIQKLRLLFGGVSADVGSVLGALSRSPDLRTALLEALRASPHAAFFWETPATTTHTLQQPFECVLIAAPSLERTRADPSAFRDHFARASSAHGSTSFSSLRGDAFLVVPTPRGDPEVYAHLAAFVRGAPLDQQHELLDAIGSAMHARLGPQPIWLSTAGLGVPWLHVRLDTTPKYYRFDPYREVPRMEGAA
jgi:hypothetical protein